MQQTTAGKQRPCNQGSGLFKCVNIPPHLTELRIQFDALSLHLRNILRLCGYQTHPKMLYCVCWNVLFSKLVLLFAGLMNKMWIVLNATRVLWVVSKELLCSC